MKTILVIEDDRFNRENLLAILEFSGFHAIGAEHGLIGLQQAQTLLPDLIICDVVMPKLDGFGVLQALRCNPKTASIPIVFLSAKADNADIRKAIDLGVDEYLVKPFTITTLVQTIFPYLDGYQVSSHALTNQT
ncbi:response regulator [Oscillatoria sp. FACHB-1407]|uniref:response regulator n=1 Tax=Oscillatoria sp. FACHB-1407 TaxID=2692847 RepID=UPI001682D422|nr:response regulator [Oscillatoria sp. FACHB-1407]MBD2459809.1 response regulator [Oscillatoria sp. FACHB-1407]